MNYKIFGPGRSRLFYQSSRHYGSVVKALQGRNEGGKGAQFRGHRVTEGDAESMRGTPKSSNNVTSTSFNAVHLLPKDLFRT